MGRTGESVRRMTNDGFSPAWFPDGNSIVYATSRGSVGGGPEYRNAFSELWTVPLEGGEPRRLFAGDAVPSRACHRTTDLQVAAVSGGAGPRLAVNDSQLFFLRGTVSADIWMARFEQPATSR